MYVIIQQEYVCNNSTGVCMFKAVLLYSPPSLSRKYNDIGITARLQIKLMGIDH